MKERKKRIMHRNNKVVVEKTENSLSSLLRMHEVKFETFRNTFVVPYADMYPPLYNRGVRYESFMYNFVNVDIPQIYRRIHNKYRFLNI